MSQSEGVRVRVRVVVVGAGAGNSAWLEIARLAWNMGKWIAQLVLP